MLGPLCLDKGYDNPTGHGTVAAFQYCPHIRRMGEEKLDRWGEQTFPARRWVVERTLARIHRRDLVELVKRGMNDEGKGRQGFIPTDWAGAECVSDAKGIFDGPRGRRRARSAGRWQQETRGDRPGADLRGS